MPENNNQNGNGNNPEGTAKNPELGNQQQQQQQQQQEPAWLQYVPEQHRESAKKDYLLQSDYTRKTQEYAEKQKAWEKERSDWEERSKSWDSFLQQYTPLREKLQAHWEKIAPILNGQQQQALANQQQQVPNNEDYWQNYDVLPPAEQAKRVAEYSYNNHVRNNLEKFFQDFNQGVSKREQFYQNYLKVLTKAITQKIKNPELDIDAYMARANEIQAGRVDPLDIAYGDVTSEATKKQIEEAAYERGRKDREEEFKNSQQSSGAFNSETIPLFRVKPLTRDQVTEAARQVAAKKNLSW
jgi:hypothetical protein